MTKKISALLFSMNEYDLIKNQIKLLYPYVDEIVIIDSSTDKKQKRLMKNLEKKYKKVRAIWLPPIGLVDLYFKIGIDQCKYEWIFQLDADEIPNRKLLEDLRKLINYKYDAYKIWRESKRFKIFKKSKAFPTGLVHWNVGIIGKNFKELEKNKYYLTQVRRGNISFRNLKTKIIKYSEIESFQIPLKILMYKYVLSNEVSFNIERREMALLYKLTKFNYVTLFIGTVLYIVFSFIYNLFYTNVFNRKVIFNELQVNNFKEYPIYCFLKFISNPFRNLFISKISFEKGIYNFLYLDNLQKYIEINRRLNFGLNGIENLMKLINFSLYLEIKRKLGLF